jgi:hypothetical protein
LIKIVLYRRIFEIFLLGAANIPEVCVLKWKNGTVVRLSEQQAVEAYRSMEVNLCAFYISALNSGE